MYKNRNSEKVIICYSPNIYKHSSIQHARNITKSSEIVQCLVHMKTNTKVVKNDFLGERTNILVL